VVVLATAQGVNDFDEDFLEDVFGLAVVLGEEVNGGIDFSAGGGRGVPRMPDPYLPDRD
jgi:hypothetical protein